MLTHYSRSKIPLTLQMYQARMIAQGTAVLGLFTWCASSSLAPKADPSRYNPYLAERLEKEAAAAVAVAAAAAPGARLH